MSLQLFIWLDRKSGRDCFKNAHYRIIAAGYNKLSIRAKSCTLDSVEFVASANWVKVITQFSAAGGIPKFRRTIHSGSNDVFAILIVSRAENNSAALFNCRMRQRSRLTCFHIPNSGSAIIAGRENKFAIAFSASRDDILTVRAESRTQDIREVTLQNNLVRQLVDYISECILHFIRTLSFKGCINEVITYRRINPGHRCRQIC